MTLFDALWLGGPMAFAVLMAWRHHRAVQALDGYRAAYRARQAEVQRLRNEVDAISADRDTALALAADWEAEAHDQAAIALSLTDTNRTN